MRLVALLTAALVVLPAAPSYAAPEPIPVLGSGCDMYWTTDPADPSRIAGHVYGEVEVADFAAPGATATVTLTCSVQLAGYSHSDPDDVTASGTGTTVAVVEPVAFSMPRPAQNNSAVCGRVDVTDASGTRTYWSNSQNGMWYTGDWGTCSGAPQCLADSPSCVWYLAFALWLVDRGWNWVLGPLDEAVCGHLRAQAPGTPPVEIRPDGDVYVAGEWLWDCAPYGT